MKKTTFVLKLVCSLLLFTVALIWLIVCVTSINFFIDSANNVDVKNEFGTIITFGEYMLLGNQDAILGFFLSLFGLVGSIYLFACALHSADFKKKSDKEDMTLIRLSRYKEMLDSGIITIDEFNSKKKDL